MNPQANQTPGLGLPQPSFDVGQAPMPQAPGAFSAPEAVPQFAAMPAIPQNPMAVPSVQQPMPQVPPAQQPVLPVTPIADVNAAAVAQQSDDDSSLDEEWVNKAREIVERTHTDPYLQSREISRIKAQYIKVRYNKDIKSSEDQP
jgi:hypothetical protein